MRGEELGQRFVDSLAKRDLAGVAALLAPEVQFRGLTPNGFWEAQGSTAVADTLAILDKWFFEEEGDALDEVASISVAPIGIGPTGERYKLSYRFAATSPFVGKWNSERGLPVADRWLVEQEAYYDVREDKITWMIVLCAGYHPADDGERAGPAGVARTAAT